MTTEPARHGPRTALTFRAYRDGSSTVSAQKINGFTFAERLPDLKGYSLLGTLASSTFSRVDFPKTFLRTLFAINTLQEIQGLGYVRCTQRSLSDDFGIASGHINNAMTYWQDVLWIRLVRDGEYQLNPFLGFKGNSGPQEIAQAEWLTATSGHVCYIPDPDHPTHWMAEKTATPASARKDRVLPFGAEQLTLIERDATKSHHRRLTLIEAIAAEPSRESEPEFADLEQLRSQGLTAQQQVRIAMKLLGAEASRGEVMSLLEEAGLKVKEQTVKSALARERSRQRAQQAPTIGRRT